MKRSTTILFTIVALTVFSGCTKGELITFSNDDGQLYKIDPTNCSETQIADLSSAQVKYGVDLTFRAPNLVYLTGQTYPSTPGELITFSDDDGQLYKIDPTNCSETQIADLSSFQVQYGVDLTFRTPDLVYLTGRTYSGTLVLDYIDISNPSSPQLLKQAVGQSYHGLSLCGGTLYGLPIEGLGAGDHLYQIDLDTLVATAIGTGIGVDLGNRDLACQASTNQLYTFGATPDSLYTIDKLTGVATLVGPLGIPIAGGVGLEFDPVSEKLYGSLDQNNDNHFELYEINPSTGLGSFLCNEPHPGGANLGSRTFPGTLVLDYYDISNPSSPQLINHSEGQSYHGLSLCGGTLYGLPAEGLGAGDHLYQIDLDTLVATAIGTGIGVDLGNRDLACQPSTNQLYTFGATPDSLYTINKLTGVATLVGPLGIPIAGGVGLEFDPVSGKLYGSLDQNNDNHFELYGINPSTGLGSFLCNEPHPGGANLGSRTVQPPSLMN